jgi:hypothetical protein
VYHLISLIRLARYASFFGHAAILERDRICVYPDEDREMVPTQGMVRRMSTSHHVEEASINKFWYRLLVADKSGLVWAAFCEGSRIGRHVSETGPTKYTTWSGQVLKLIIDTAPPGVLSVYEEIDVTEY